MTGKDKLQARPLAAVLSTALVLMLCKDAVKPSSSYSVLGLLLALSALKASLWYADKPFAKGSEEEDWGYVMHSVFNFTLLILASKYLRSFTTVQNTVEQIAEVLRLPNLLTGWYACMVPVLFLAITVGKNFEQGGLPAALSSVASFCVLAPEKWLN